jgi:hypothetical protein
MATIDACWSAFKRGAIPTPEDLRLFTEVLAVCDDNQCYPEDAMEWAKTHILNPKLLGSVKGLHRAICGEGVSPTNGLLAQFKDHNPNACGICLKKTPSSEPDSSRAERTPCLCGKNCKGFCPLEVEMESKPSGGGFSHEEAE